MSKQYIVRLPDAFNGTKVLHIGMKKIRVNDGMILPETSDVVKYFPSMVREMKQAKPKEQILNEAPVEAAKVEVKETPEPDAPAETPEEKVEEKVETPVEEAKPAPKKPGRKRGPKPRTAKTEE